MPDRSLRPLMPTPLPERGGRRSGVLLRDRPSSAPDASSGRTGSGHSGNPGGSGQDDNPFAPPPEGSPDRPWQPRRPDGADGPPGNGNGSSGSSGSSGSPDDGSRGGEGGGGPVWGSGWSDQQPGRSSGGGFGDRPGGRPDGPTGPGGGPTPRWDPTDPAQRRARYALLGGMWAFFFALFSWPYVALLLGALALYWGISALNTKPRTPDPDSPAPQQPTGGRPQTTAAVSGIVAASLAIVLVGATFVAQLVYSDYYTCRSDALTNEQRQSCDRLLPEQLRDVLGQG
ncbi:hypothetical protein ACFXAZ_04325 [Streptomyces sp. NPDC059477]|uniref:hypothetical protein n=1 Tax=Streptomyces sp. NPDC059477 TaxID=3346847 RepID=UPI0036A46753